MYIRNSEAMIIVKTINNVLANIYRHQSLGPLHSNLRAKPMAESQRISQQRQYLGRCPVVTGGGVTGAK